MCAAVNTRNGWIPIIKNDDSIKSTTTPQRGGLNSDPKRVHKKNNTHPGDAENAEFTV